MKRPGGGRAGNLAKWWLLLNKPEKNDDLLVRIEDLWLEAAATLPENRVDAPKASPQEEFERIRASFEAIAKLQPPGAEREKPAGAGAAPQDDSAFNNAFNDLIRSVVQDYIRTDLESTIRNAVRGEIEAHQKSRASD